MLCCVVLCCVVSCSFLSCSAIFSFLSVLRCGAVFCGCGCRVFYLQPIQNKLSIGLFEPVSFRLFKKRLPKGVKSRLAALLSVSKRTGHPLEIVVARWVMTLHILPVIQIIQSS